MAKENLDEEERAILHALEGILGKELPIRDEIEWNTRGVQIESGRIIGISFYDMSIGTNRKLSEFWDCLYQLRHLKTIHLYKNELTALPDSFGNLHALRYLDLGRNQLAALPDSFGNLHALRYLDLGRNQLAALPDSFGNLHALQTLHLSENQLVALPDSFGNLHALRYLDLGENQLAALPDSFGNLHALQTLHLSENRLAALPDWFGNLHALQRLDLGGNQLAVLPDSFGNLYALQTLDLRGNPLTIFPSSLMRLESLRELNGSYLPMLDFPWDEFGSSKSNFENLTRGLMDNLATIKLDFTDSVWTVAESVLEMIIKMLKENPELYENPDLTHPDERRRQFSAFDNFIQDLQTRYELVRSGMNDSSKREKENILSIFRRLLQEPLFRESMLEVTRGDKELMERME